jgi:hypothetical protein
MGFFYALYDYKSLEKLISNHSMIELSILFSIRIYNYNSYGYHFDVFFRWLIFMALLLFYLVLLLWIKKR